MIRLLDCTIRDGSYAVDNRWTPEDVAAIVGELSAAGIEYIEVGTGTGLGAYRNLRGALDDDSYAESAARAKGRAKIGAFFIPGIGTREDLRRFRDNGGDFVRIGTNVSDSKKAVEFIEAAKSLGFEVGYNFMKTYVTRPFEICVRATEVAKAGADVISIVDSAGGMLPEQVARYVRALKECVSCRIGFHGHNNLLLANANSLAAAQSGAQVIDATLMGLGRGAGNAQTETLVVVLLKAELMSGLDPMRLSRIAEKHILKYAANLKGSDSMQLALGYSLFHDSYMPLVEKLAARHGVDPKTLIIETAKINRENPSEELIDTVACQLKEKQRVEIQFPKFFHREYR